MWRDKYPSKLAVADAALWQDKYWQPLQSSSAFRASVAQPRPRSVRSRRRRRRPAPRDASTVGSFDTLSYHSGARTVVMVHRDDMWCREHRRGPSTDPWVVGIFQRPDCRYLELRAKREAPRGLELSLRISDRQIAARAHDSDLQFWATRVLPHAIELHFHGAERRLPKLRLRREFFKYLLYEEDTPNMVGATLHQSTL